MADNGTMTAGERSNLLRAVQIARDPNASRDQVKEAGRIQRELKKKYPNTYGAIRGEMFEAVTTKAEMAKGGMANKKGKQHMYAAGGSVKMNPGLKALKAASPAAYKKITGQ